MDLWKNKYAKIIAILFLVIIITPLILYWIYYGKLNLSKASFSNWRDFSDYFSLYISIINVGATIILTYLIITQTKKNHQEILNFQKQAELPVLIFFMDEKSTPNYKIKNIGKDSAINVSLFIRSSGNDQNESNLMMPFYSLGSSDEKKSDKINSFNLLALKYFSVYGEEFYSFMKDDIMYHSLNQGDVGKKLMKDMKEWKVLETKTLMDGFGTYSLV